MAQDGVDVSIIDPCQYGQATVDGQPIQKATKWMSNSPRILQMLQKRCSGRGGSCSRPRGGQHQHVSGRVCRKSQEYPFELCKAILMGCRRQLIDDGRLALGVIGIQRPEESFSEKQLIHVANLYLDADMDVQAGLAEKKDQFNDSLTGQPLNADLVRAARRKELEYFAAKRVWRKVPRADALRLQGKPPITVKWIDVNKGEDESPNY